MNIIAFGATDVGKRRQNNEDHYVIDESLGLYLVCDGMGGHAAGEVASETAANVVRDYVFSRRAVLENARSLPDGYFRVLKLAEAAAQQASRELYRLARSDANYAGMGTTLTLLLIVDDKAAMAHVGDSRLYLLREGQLHQLSADHTLAQELYAAGAIESDELYTSRSAHILTRAIGTQEGVQVETLLFDLLPDDVVLLCSDGLSNYFADADETVQMLKLKDFESVPGRLVQFANEKGGRDNISLIVLRASARGRHTVSQREHALKIMRQVALFEKLSLNRLVRLLNAASICGYKEGHKIIGPSDKIDGLFLVLSGELTRQRDGAAIPVRAGETFGEMALLQPYRSTESIRASRDTQILHLEQRSFDRLARRLPRFGYHFLRRISKKSLVTSRSH